MKIKLDENLSKEAAQIFRQVGHDTESVFTQGLAGSSDQKIISVCQSEKRCLVTLDLDFANPFLFPPNRYSGIAVFRLPLRPSYSDLLILCRTLLAALGEKDIDGKLWIVQKNRIREYQPETDIEAGVQ
jgi:predicted nuclease of predicted toxin-antitoxin system